SAPGRARAISAVGQRDSSVAHAEKFPIALAQSWSAGHYATNLAVYAELCRHASCDAQQSCKVRSSDTERCVRLSHERECPAHIPKACRAGHYQCAHPHVSVWSAASAAFRTTILGAWAALP